MKFFYLINISICLFSSYLGLGQNKSTIIIQSRVSKNAVELNYFPGDVMMWKDGLTSGYTVTREVINEASGSAARQFASQYIQAKDASWFTKNVTKMDGVLSPIGQLLYDPNFSLPSSGNNQTWEIKYNYIVYESTRSQEVASAVGLGLTDANINPGSKYRYTVKHNKSGQSAAIEVLCNDGATGQVPADYRPNFVFPDGISLSEMGEMSKPFVLEAIIGKAMPKIDSIMLRWGPSTPEIWRSAMEDGYEIYRTDAGDKRVKIATIFPWAESKFKEISLKDTLSLLAASIVKDKGIPQKMANTNFFEKASTAGNYFGFALYVADRSPLAAQILGLSYVDKDVKPGETYIYEISTKKLTNSTIPMDIIVVNEYEPLLPPEGFSIIKGEKSVVLQWLAKSNLTNYSSYVVERSRYRDTLYEVLTDPPLVFIKDATNPQAFFKYEDKLSSNNQVYFYKLKGSNAFGEWSDYATAKGFGKDLTPPEPVSILTGLYLKDSIQIRISWTQNKKDKDIKYQQVLMSEDKEYNYAAISKELNPRDTNFYFSVKEMETDRPFYFKIMTVDSSGNEATSILKYVSVPDLERPETPQNVKAIIDSTGKVNISWSPSKSKDVTGYYIYYSNDDASDLTMINDFLHEDTTYSWTIPLNTITKNLYIGIKAEDDNYNKSFITDVVTLRRPDTIAPAKPFIALIELKNDFVNIQWKKSSSSDIEKYVLYRRQKLDTSYTWIAIDTLDRSSLDYTDMKPPFGTSVQYSLIALDDFKNASVRSNEVQIKVPFPKNKYKPEIIKIGAVDKSSIALSWKRETYKIADQDMKYKFEIFKSTGSKELALYKELSPAEFGMTDMEVFAGVLHNYAVRIKYDNGWTSALSEVKSIIIK